jgi:hypothetical protein
MCCRNCSSAFLCTKCRIERGITDAMRARMRRDEIVAACFVAPEVKSEPITDEDLSFDFAVARGSR